MKDTKRALRRHHRQRMLQRALRSYALNFFPTELEDKEWQMAMALRRYNNMKKCSCFMCGNRRKFEKCVTTQEKKQQEAACYEIAQYWADYPAIG